VSTSQQTTSPSSGSSGTDVTRSEDASATAPPAERGTTTLADVVVAKVAGIAAREVGGVHDIGGAASRALGSVTQRVGLGDERTRGVSVEVGQREAAVDLSMIIEYGESIPQVTDAVRQNIIKRVEGITGLAVTEVNIAVNDLHFADEDDEASAPTRVD
jgi:uncharacterized alkaline shock family protein YloU